MAVQQSSGADKRHALLSKTLFVKLRLQQKQDLIHIAVELIFTCHLESTFMQAYFNRAFSLTVY